MAPYIQPKTLYQLALAHIGKAVGASCDKILSKYGGYENPETLKEASVLQNYLLASVSGMVVDELCEEQRFGGYSGSDIRIKLAVFMHPLMKKFSVAQRSWEFKQDLDDFWIQKIPSLTRLVVLSLYHVATDEIIEVVSCNCPLLEEINIVSKVENANDSELDNFNAMKLKLFVSDNGLNHLVRCKKLRVIITNKTLRSNCGGRMMTHDGFRALLKGLPNLQMVRYGDLGSVIASGLDNVSKLALTYVSDNHPNASHMEAISRLCPHLEHLSLSLPHQEKLSGPGAMSEDVARSVSQSDLKPSILELSHFVFNVEVERMFTVKGVHLTSLFLCAMTMTVITSREVIIIGQNCPQVKNVHIKGLGAELPASNLSRSLARPPPMFQNLKCLYIAGKSWDIEYVLQLFLSHATELTGLNLWNTTLSPESDEALNKVISYLTFNELKSANFCYGCRLSEDVVRKFIQRCPKLTHLTLFVHESLPSSLVDQIQCEVAVKNFDLEVLPLNIA